MKKHSNGLFAAIKNETLSLLTKEVKETIAFGFTTPSCKIFTVADLWNIHSHAKTRTTRRYL